MARRHKRSSRSAPVSEAEIGLQWELQRLRKELAATRAKLSAKHTNSGKDVALSEEDVADVIMRMERICRRTVKAVVPPGMSCETCGGVSWYQFEQAMIADVWTHHIMMGSEPGDLPWPPDENPRPGYDDQPGRLDFTCIGSASKTI